MDTTMSSKAPFPVSRPSRQRTAVARAVDAGFRRERITFDVFVPKAGRVAPKRRDLMRVLVEHVAVLPEKDVAGALRALLKEGLVFESRQPTLATTPSSRKSSRGRNAVRTPDNEALERAFARADTARDEILARPDMLTGEQIAERLGLSRATIDNRRVAGKMLAVDLGTKRGLRYPEWQCDLLRDTAGRTGFEKVLGALGKTDPWPQYRFFTQAAPALGGRSPIDAIRAGEVNAVARAAATWAAGEQGGG